MKQAYVFPGQGAQKPGMGKELFETNPQANELYRQADEILGFAISKIMFEGSPEELQQTKVTQPAVFLDSIIQFLCLAGSVPAMTAGHSLGEFSALVAAGVLDFEDALKLVSRRAEAMQKACEINPSTMAAIIGLDDRIVEEVCSEFRDEIVVAANYNCPGQLVISGSLEGINQACERMKERGARRALPLPVGGAFHSPLMQPAEQELKEAIEGTVFHNARCPVFQNVHAQGETEAIIIQKNLEAQLTAPVRWTQSVKNMIANGATEFIECGPGKVLSGLINKIDAQVLCRTVIV